MAAYLIARIEVTYPERYREYTSRTPALIAEHGGRFVVRGGEAVTLEGDDAGGGRWVLGEFPSLDAVKRFYASPGYQHAKSLRAGAATATFVAVDGV